MTAPRILIGIPAFRGSEFIAETLDSIVGQDYGDFRALISVDGSDEETAAACAPFLDDPRFSLIVQNERLGWDGNLNWLMSRQEYDFFCYWQQDDYTTPDYLSGLLMAATTHPSAVCYFSDIQWIGRWNHHAVSPSITGFAINRAISVFEGMNGIPQRGLIRKSAIDRIGGFRRTENESAFEEIVWLARLAREGNLHRVEGPTYFKRMHDESTHGKWLRKDRAWKRAVWLKFGLAMLDVIWPLVPETERLSAFAVVLDRLCIPRPERYLLFDGSRVPFACDFLLRALEQFHIPELAAAITATGRPAYGGSAAGELLDQAIAWSYLRQTSSADIPSLFQFGSGGEGIDLLVSGWSVAETWGIWSDGPMAELRLPVGVKRGTWNLKITCRTFGKHDSTVPIDIMLDPGWASPQQWLADANHIVEKQLSVESEGTDVTLRFRFPDVASPKELGYSDDQRLLGLGLISLELYPVNTGIGPA